MLRPIPAAHDMTCPCVRPFRRQDCRYGLMHAEPQASEACSVCWHRTVLLPLPSETIERSVCVDDVCSTIGTRGSGYPVSTFTSEVFDCYLTRILMKPTQVTDGN